MKKHAIMRSLVVLSLIVPLLTSGCSTLKGLAALRDVAFSLDRVTDIDLAGVRLDGIASYEDIRALDAVRIGGAIAQNELPLAFTLHVGAENPADNTVQARLVRMDWTLLLEDRETISGTFTENVVLPPGEPQVIPFGIELDLIQFFDSNLRDLAELALSLSGQGGAPKNVKLRATPTIDTALGPIRYPQPITIVSRTVG